MEGQEDEGEDESVVVENNTSDDVNGPESFMVLAVSCPGEEEEARDGEECPQVFEEMSDEEIEHIFESLRLTDSEFFAFVKDPSDSDVSLASWREELLGLVEKEILDEGNIGIVLKRILQEKHFLVVYQEGSKSHNKIATLLSALNQPYHLVSKRVLEYSERFIDFLEQSQDIEYTLPFVIYDGKMYRDHLELEQFLYEKIIGSESKAKPEREGEEEYDLIVIGAGSAGLMAAIQAKKYCSRVALIDKIVPNPTNNVQVCKRIMHHLANLQERVRFGYKNGFIINEEVKWSWETFVENLSQYLKRKNFGDRLSITRENVESITAKAKFINEKEIKLSYPSEDDKSEDKIISAKYYIIAISTRPKYPKGILGAENYCITSDDLFLTRTPPRDTLIIGDTAEGLECAGVLCTFSYNVTIITHSKLSVYNNLEESFLNAVRNDLEVRGVRFVEYCRVLRVSPAEENSEFRVFVEGLYKNGEAFEEKFHTVVVAVGRVPCTDHLGLTNTRVEVNKSRYLVVDRDDRTTQPNVFAIGDIAEGRTGSATAADRSAVYLIERLFDMGVNTVNHGIIPSIVYTPLEYASVGINEETAKTIVRVELLKEISVYESKSILSAMLETRVKVLCAEDEEDFKKIMGLHILGHEISEIVQGLIPVIIGRALISLDKVLCPYSCRSLFNNLVLSKVISSRKDEYRNEISKDILSTISQEDPKNERIYNKLECIQEKHIKSPDYTSIISAQMSSCSEASVVDELRDKMNFMEMSFVNENNAETSTPESVHVDCASNTVLLEASDQQDETVKTEPIVEDKVSLKEDSDAIEDKPPDEEFSENREAERGTETSNITKGDIP